MNYDKILLSSLNIECSEILEDEDTLFAKFIVCDFKPNLNDLMINRKTISNWLNTIINKPVVGSLGVSDTGNVDFEGHNLFPVVRIDKNGKPYKDTKFYTSAMGVFTDVTIEKIKGKECIVANSKIWKRFPEFCAVFKKRVTEGALRTSFEIGVKKSHKEVIGGKEINVVDDAIFLGHALLGAKIPPAYENSRVIEVASQNENQEIIEAILSDISNIIPEQEDGGLKNKIINDENEGVAIATDGLSDGITEPTKQQAENANDEGNTVETSALTSYDLSKRIREEIAKKLGTDNWGIDIIFHFPVEKTVWVKTYEDETDLDITVFTYTVENDIVTVSEPEKSKLAVSVAEINKTVAELNSKLQEKDNFLVDANDKIQALNTKISTLEPFKEKFEIAEQERISKELAEKQSELKEYALKSGHITEKEIAEDDNIKQMIEKVDETSIKNIIAERFMKTLENKEETPVVATASVVKATPKANIADDSNATVDCKTFIKAYLSK